MIYAKDTNGKLRSFTTDCPNENLEAISTFDKVEALKREFFDETKSMLTGAVLCVVKPL